MSKLGKEVELVECDVPKPFTLYWSNLVAYESCPQKFLWKRGWDGIDVGAGPGEPKPKPEDKSRHHAIMGIVIQDVVETFYNDEEWRHPDGLAHRLIKMTKASFAQELSKNYIDWKISPSQTELLETCISGVMGYLRTMKRHKLLGPYARAEVKLKGWIDNYTPIGGYADMVIRRDDTGITILDGKNAKTKNEHVDPDQLRFYALCFYLSYNKVMPDRLGFVWYRYPYDGKGEEGVEWVDFTKRDLQRLAQRAKDARTKMHYRKFEATPSSKACKWCDYESVCPERAVMREQNRRGPRVTLPVVDNATGFVEFDLNSDVQAGSGKGK